MRFVVIFRKIYPWIMAIRFKTLIAAFVPVLVGTAIAESFFQKMEIWVSLYALGSAACIQIATNLFNDAIDFKKGADKDRVGPTRVTQSGLLSEKQVWMMAIGFLILALVLGFPLVIRGGIPIVVLGIVSLFLAYGYTGGPYPLAYLGLGDLFVVLFFGLFAVGGTTFLHTLSMNPAVIVAGLQMGFLSTILIAINNLRDSETDVHVNKKTLAVRFGDKFVRWEIMLLTIATYMANLYYLVAYEKLYVLLSYALIPLGGLIVGFVFMIENKEKLNPILGLAALHQLLFAGLFSYGVIL